jgi:hypothetical protein
MPLMKADRNLPEPVDPTAARHTNKGGDAKVAMRPIDASPRQDRRRKVNGLGPTRPPNEGATMSDKSPRQTMKKKSGKSLKEKRADKRTKAEHSSTTEAALHFKKH